MFFYADDVQFYITLNNTNAFDASVITNCIKAVEQWLTLKKLQLNHSKAQCIVFSCKHLFLMFLMMINFDEVLVMSNISEKI